MNRGRSVLVTGASGYAGGAIAAWLRRVGYRVVTAGRRAGDDIRIDLSRPGEVTATHLPADIDTCVHVAAAHEGICASDPALAESINVAGTAALLRAAEAAGIERLVYVSTFHVFGVPAGRVAERRAPTPRNAYGQTHWMAEQLFRAYAARRGGYVHILRPANLFGVPADWQTFNRWSLAPFDFARQAVRDGRIRLRSDGRQIRSYVSLDHLSRAVAAAIAGELPETTHVAGGHLRIGELAALCAEVAKNVAGEPVPLELGPPSADEPDYQFCSEYWPQEVDAGEMAAFLRHLIEQLRGAAR